MTHGRIIKPGEEPPPFAPNPPQARPRRAGGRGRFGVLNAFVDATMRQLDGSTVKIWFILFRDTKPNGLVRASDTDLARRAGLCLRTVYTARKRLERLGLLEVHRRGGLGMGPSVYRIRGLPAEAHCELQLAICAQNPQQPVASIPEGTQNGVPTLESGTPKNRKGAATRQPRRDAVAVPCDSDLGGSPHGSSLHAGPSPSPTSKR